MATEPILWLQAASLLVMVMLFVEDLSRGRISRHRASRVESIEPCRAECVPVLQERVPPIE